MEGQAPAGAEQDRTKTNRTKQQLHKKGELNYGYEYWRLSRIRKQVQGSTARFQVVERAGKFFVI